PAPASEQAAEQILQVDVAEGAGPEAGGPAATRTGPGPPSTRTGAPGPGTCSRPHLRVDIGRHLPEPWPERVVAPPGLGVAEHVVGLGDVLEALLGLRALVDVRVILTSQLAVRALDL